MTYHYEAEHAVAHHRRHLFVRTLPSELAKRKKTGANISAPSDLLLNGDLSLIRLSPVDTVNDKWLPPTSLGAKLLAVDLETLIVDVKPVTRCSPQCRLVKTMNPAVEVESRFPLLTGVIRNPA